MSEAMQAEFGLKHNVYLILRAGNSSLLRALGVGFVQRQGIHQST